MNKIITVLISAMMAANSYAALVISNSAATSLTTTSMVFNAVLASTNGTTNAVTATVFYGTVDYTTNAGSWAYSNVYGTVDIGNLSTSITGLLPSHKYYFAWFVVEGTNSDWATPSLSAWTKPIAPTSTPDVVTISVQTDTDGVLKAPTNFFSVNSNLVKEAVGPMGDSNAMWGNITGTLANQLDLTNTVALAAAAYPSSNPSNFVTASVTNALSARVDGLTNGAALGETAVQPATFEAHTTNTANPHAVTAAQVGAVPTNDPNLLTAEQKAFAIAYFTQKAGTNMYARLEGSTVYWDNVSTTGTNVAQNYLVGTNGAYYLDGSNRVALSGVSFVFQFFNGSAWTNVFTASP